MKFFITIVLILSFFLIASCGEQEKPENLTIARKDVKEYYESGRFYTEVEDVVKEAEKEFDKIKIKNNSAVVFDVDETALDNYALAKSMGFGYVYKMNKEWNAEMKSPALKPVKELYDYLLERGVHIIFLTGRNFPEYEVTYQNLKNVGYTVFDTLITQIGDETKMKSRDFKSSKRVFLTNEGYDIIGTVGDKWSDLRGEDHGIQVKIPNYLYKDEY
ncbi:MAG: HAD family acid phosphatase [Ignavibacteriaceae bacterium]